MTTVDPATVPPVGATLDCGHILTDELRHSLGTHSTGQPFGTGYARTQDGRTLCYPCADESERDAMRDASSFVAYVSSSGDLTTWSGGLLARGVPYMHGVSRNGWHGSEIHSWRFRSDDGSEWYGRNAGAGMVIRVRRALHGAR